MAQPECWECKVPIEDQEQGHHVVTQNWVDAIVNRTPLLAPGEEGIKGLTLSNAMYLSSWIDDWVELPINEDVFYERLQNKMLN